MKKKKPTKKTVQLIHINELHNINITGIEMLITEMDKEISEYKRLNSRSLCDKLLDLLKPKPKPSQPLVNFYASGCTAFSYMKADGVQDALIKLAELKTRINLL